MEKLECLYELSNLLADLRQSVRELQSINDIIARGSIEIRTNDSSYAISRSECEGFLNHLFDSKLQKLNEKLNYIQKNYIFNITEL